VHRPTHGFDVIIVEEQLYPNKKRTENIHPSCKGTASILEQSGSNLIHTITCEQKHMKPVGDTSYGDSKEKSSPQYSFIIGVSAYINEHYNKLEASGADIVWGKPPPSMGAKLRYELLEAVLQKRS